MIEKTVYDIGKANQHVRWAFSRLHFMPSHVKEMLKQDDVWRDLVQELYFVAYDSWKQNFTIKETRNYAGRRIRQFFKNYGYREYRWTIIRQDIPFSVLPSYEEKALNESEPEPEKDFRTDIATDNHMEERIISILRNQPKGIDRHTISVKLGIQVKETRRYLDKLVKEGKVVEAARESWRSTSISPLYFIAGSVIPEQSKVRSDFYKAIWHAYFVEGKSKYRIRKETGRDPEAITKAIKAAPPELVNSMA